MDEDFADSVFPVLNGLRGVETGGVVFADTYLQQV